MKSAVPAFVLRKLAGAVALLVGVTLVSFVLMVQFGPDQTWTLLGKNPTAAEIAEVRAQLGYDRPFALRYLEYLRELATLDFGNSNATGEPVAALLGRTLPVSLALLAPGFVLGNLLGLLFALIAAWFRGGPIDKAVTTLAVLGMSVSFLVVIIACQLVFGVWLGWFPVRGWNVHGVFSYIEYVALPTLASVVVAVGYNTRFFRAVLVDQIDRDHVRTARAFGAGPLAILFHNVLANALVPILTRVLFTIPLIVVSGSLLIESYFGVPGIGKATFDAIVSGDQPVLKAVVGLSGVLFVIVQLAADAVYRWADPRIAPQLRMPT